MNKVIHIIENFNGQATENWLFQTMRHLAALGERVDWTFYATLGRPGAMDDAIRALGGKIIYSPAPLQNKLKFLRELRKFIYEGNYDILHSHHDIVSAVYLLASLGLPLKKRIVHVHNTSLSIPTSSLLKNALLHEPMRQACLHWADNVVGVSSTALDTFLGESRHKKNRDLIIHCGIDTAPFHIEPPNRLDFLKSLGLPNNAKVLLFVGRMIEYKNPCFVIEVLAHASKFDPNICAIFAGSGPLEDKVNEMARRNSLEHRVKVLGWHEDIPSLMHSCDMLIWPGLEEPKEGLGLGVVEAQAAGLPVLMSLSVPDEAIVEPNLVRVLPLQAGADVWADNILDVINRRPQNKKDALAMVESSSFSIAQSAENIQKLYESQHINIKVKNAERIIFVPFIYGFGGVERLVLALSSFLHKHDIDHKIVCFNQTIDFSTYANWPMTVEELAPQRNPLSEICALSFYMQAARKNGSPAPLFFDLKGAFYGGFLPGIDYYLHLTDPPSLLPSEISKFALSLRKIYPSLREKSNFNLNLMIRGELVQQINRRGASKALSVIAMSNVIADELHQIYEVKAKIIRPGVEKPTSSLTSSLRVVDKFRIISVCRLEANKRLDWILNALADLESSVVPLSNKIDWSLDVVGDGSMREELQELARQRGIAKRVVFHGKIPDLTVHDLIDDAHLFLMPAVQGYGLPALEALARGVPVILHRQSGVSEVLKGTPWAEIFDGDTVDLGSAINIMIERIGSNDLTKNTMPTFPSEADWAHEICMLCKWL